MGQEAAWILVCASQEMVDWFNAIRAARFHYLQVAFPGAGDEEVRMTTPSKSEERRLDGSSLLLFSAAGS